MQQLNQEDESRVRVYSSIQDKLQTYIHKHISNMYTLVCVYDNLEGYTHPSHRRTPPSCV
jgi:hypothetical protein